MSQMPKLNKVTPEMWAKALLSGIYPQTTGCLTRATPSKGKPAGFCCLGVLADLLNPKAWTNPNSRGMQKWGTAGAKSSGSLPDDIWSHFLTDNKLDPKLFNQDMFITLNDDDYLSFTRIASTIRRYAKRSKKKEA